MDAWATWTPRLLGGTQVAEAEQDSKNLPRYSQ